LEFLFPYGHKILLHGNHKPLIKFCKQTESTFENFLYCNTEYAICNLVSVNFFLLATDFAFSKLLVSRLRNLIIQTKQQMNWIYKHVLICSLPFSTGTYVCYCSFCRK